MSGGIFFEKNLEMQHGGQGFFERNEPWQSVLAQRKNTTCHLGVHLTEGAMDHVMLLPVMLVLFCRRIKLSTRS